MSTRVDLSTRYSVLIKAALNSGRGEVLNLSEGGAYVATQMSLLPQAQVKLRVSVPHERRPMELEGVVTWENRGTNRRLGQPPGYGLRFTRIPEKSRVTLRRIVRGALPHPEITRAPEAPSARTAPVVLSPPPLAPPQPAPSFVTVEEVEAGPYRLALEILATRVPEAGPGIFVLYYNRAQEARVGRADRDPRGALAQFIGEYGFFWFETVPSIEDAYRRECKLFHHYGGDRGQLDVTDHPFPPEGLDHPECIECGAHQQAPAPS